MCHMLKELRVGYNETSMRYVPFEETIKSLPSMRSEAVTQKYFICSEESLWNFLRNR
jgi:hypothetical protein